MKVVAINGSARKNGNTSILIEKVFEPLRKSGFECEQIQMAGHTVQGCRACYKCSTKRIIIVLLRGTLSMNASIK